MAKRKDTAKFEVPVGDSNLSITVDATDKVLKFSTRHLPTAFALRDFGAEIVATGFTLPVSSNVGDSGWFTLILGPALKLKTEKVDVQQTETPEEKAAPEVPAAGPNP